MIAPSKQQAAILAFLEAHLKTFGRPPTRKEIALAFQFKSANAAQCHLKAMQDKGMLRLTPKLARGIRIGTVVRVGDSDWLPGKAIENPVIDEDERILGTLP